jgi:enamine deaminase RidA (YjgF/YER057c/UK114 family)
MAVEHLNPVGVPSVDGISQVSIGRGSRVVFFSGQIGRMLDGNPAGDDLRSQTAQALRNLQAVAEAAGVTAADITKTTIMIKDYDAARFDEFLAGFGDYIGAGGTIGTVAAASTLIGVAALYEPWCHIEIDATAIVD